jgi:hypothetical protein
VNKYKIFTISEKRKPNVFLGSEENMNITLPTTAQSKRKQVPVVTVVSAARATPNTKPTTHTTTIQAQPRKHVERPRTTASSQQEKKKDTLKVSSKPAERSNNVRTAPGSANTRKKSASTDRAGTSSAGKKNRTGSGSSRPASARQKSVHVNPLAIAIDDIQTAFQWYSQDNKIISKEDLKRRLEQCLHPDKVGPFLKEIKHIMGHEGHMTFVGLKNICTSRKLVKKAMEEAFTVSLWQMNKTALLLTPMLVQLLEPESPFMSNDNFYRILTLLLDKSVVVKHDLAQCLQRFDRDGDGAIGFSDFKSI